MNTPHDTAVEAAIINEILTHQWATKAQVNATREAISSERIGGPIHRALAEQRLLKPSQVERLDEFYHKDLQIDRFTVERKLGSGAMGDVFLASDPKTGERCAVKLISKRFADDEQFLKRFEREIAALAKLHHEHIANAVAFGRHDGLPFLAMEHIAGPSLAQLLSKHGPLPESYVLRVARQIAAGIDYVFNETQLVHRDIKPENILVIPPEEGERKDLYCREDKAVLIDFGLARSFADSERLTMTGVTMGTPHYMSPEQIRGSQHLDAHSDQYGLGATLYHLLCGRTPYAGNSPGAVMTAHLTEPIPDPRNLVPSISEGARSVVMASMAKDPRDRFRNFEAMITACDHAIDALGSVGTMRLVRKPLVIKNPKNVRTDRIQRTNGANAGNPAPPTGGGGSDIELPTLVDSGAAPATDTVRKRSAEAEPASSGNRDAVEARMRQKARTLRQQGQQRDIGEATPNRATPLRVDAPVTATANAAPPPGHQVTPTRNHRLRSQGSDRLPQPPQPDVAAAHFPSSGEKAVVNVTGEEDPTGPSSATDALLRLQTDRVRTPSNRLRRQATAATPLEVHQKQPGRPPVGVAPLAILCISVIVLITLVIYQTFLR